jgi:hypothetical protein
MARSFAPRSPSNRLSGADRLTDFELGWVVGLLEGEGCCFITRRVKGPYGPYLDARVTVCMTDGDVLDGFSESPG